MIAEIYKKRAHVVNYSSEIIPTRKEIDDILLESLPLSTSKQKAFAFKAFVLKHDKEKNDTLYKWCDGFKVDQDIDYTAKKGIEEKHVTNKGLLHVRSAPWIIIWTPFPRDPNAYYKKGFTDTNSWRQMDELYLIKDDCREQCAMEGSMMAQMVLGICLEKGWDSSFNICFPRFDSEKLIKHNPRWLEGGKKKQRRWTDIHKDITITPFLMQSIGKASRYMYQERTDKQRLMNTTPSIEDLFEFI